MIRKVGRFLRIVLINLLITFILLELGSAAFYYWKTREFFYTRPRSQDRYASSFAPVATTLNESIFYRLHPYFGYTYKPGFHPALTVLGANSDGFVSIHNYPFKRETPNQYIIAIFGGSVAQYLTMHEFDRHILANSLRGLPGFQNKEVVILNFSLPGGKQPQQAMILSYFLSLGQDLDLVVNLDGFNEVYEAAHSNKHLVDIPMPSIAFELPLLEIANNDLSPRMANLVLSILQDKDRLKSLLIHAKESKLASSYLLRAIRIKHYTTVYGRHQLEFSRASLESSKQKKQDPIVRINRIEAPLEDEAVYRKAASIWASGSLAMNDILAHRGIPYFHFIQPNQYYPGRTFSETERKIAFSQYGGNEFAESVRKGYPMLLSKIADLRNSNVAVFSAVTIFDDIAEPVYVDDCCHYTGLGNDVFLQYISSEIGKALALTPKN